MLFKIPFLVWFPLLCVAHLPIVAHFPVRYLTFLPFRFQEMSDRRASWDTTGTATRSKYDMFNHFLMVIHCSSRNAMFCLEDGLAQTGSVSLCAEKPFSSPFVIIELSSHSPDRRQRSHRSSISIHSIICLCLALRA